VAPPVSSSSSQIASSSSGQINPCGSNNLQPGNPTYIIWNGALSPTIYQPSTCLTMNPQSTNFEMIVYDGVSNFRVTLDLSGSDFLTLESLVSHSVGLSQTPGDGGASVLSSQASYGGSTYRAESEPRIFIKSITSAGLVGCLYNYSGFRAEAPPQTAIANTANPIAFACSTP
jgi:hypothetical protein